MDKKKIQIAIIVGCMLLTAGILYFGYFSGGSAPEAPQGIAPINTNVDSVVDVPAESSGEVGEIPSSEGIIIYSAPATFPASSELDLSVYDTSKFKALQDYTPLSVTPEEIGRENPFESYQ